jgi:uncharacterized membrane protein
VDPASLVLNALTSGAVQGAAYSVSDAVNSAYGKLRLLVSARLSGNKPAEVALAKHATDPETWQAPPTKALTASSVGADQAVIEAARQLMALLDPAGTEQGKYQVDLPGAQRVRLAMATSGSTPFNTVTPTIMMASPIAGTRLVGEERGCLRASLRGCRRAGTPRQSTERGPRGQPLGTCSTSMAGAAVSRRSSARYEHETDGRGSGGLECRSPAGVPMSAERRPSAFQSHLRRAPSLSAMAAQSNWPGEVGPRAPGTDRLGQLAVGTGDRLKRPCVARSRHLVVPVRRDGPAAAPGGSNVPGR